MRKTILFTSLMAIGMVIAAGNAQAAKCKGYGVGQGSKPVVVYKGKDGAQVMIIKNTRVNITEVPANSPTNKVWQTCTGLWMIAAGGKSGSGNGSCFAVDMEGDTYTTSWAVRRGSDWSRTARESRPGFPPETESGPSGACGPFPANVSQTG